MCATSTSLDLPRTIKSVSALEAFETYVQVYCVAIVSKNENSIQDSIRSTGSLRKNTLKQHSLPQPLSGKQTEQARLPKGISGLGVVRRRQSSVIDEVRIRASVNLNPDLHSSTSTQKAARMR